jgi:hypothetical protein
VALADAWPALACRARSRIVDLLQSIVVLLHSIVGCA